MTVGKRFIITSGVLVLSSTILACVSALGFTSVATSVHSLATDTIPGVTYAYAMSVDIATMRGNQLRHILSTDAADMQKWEKLIAEDHQHFAADSKRYEESITDETVDRPNFAKLSSELEAFDAAWEKVVPLSRASKNEEATKLYMAEARPRLLALQDQLGVIVEWNRKGSDVTIASTAQTVHTALWTVIAIGILSITFGIGLSWFMITALNTQLTRSSMDLSEGSDQVSSAATQVSASSQSLAKDTSEQAAMIEETSASAEEINSMAKRNAESARSATALVVEAVNSTEQTNRAVDDCVTAMDAIGESSSKIAKTLQVIDKIAFQTNILALNAAVEAARAGESGAGFAVVAEEVRNLAHRCSAASEEISALIEQSLGNSDSGRAKMATLVESGAKVNQVFASMKVLVEEISLSSEEQGRGIDQIGRAIQKMEQGTQKSAANAEESAAAAEQLTAQSQQLREVASDLGMMVGLAPGGASLRSSSHAHKFPQRSVASATTSRRSASSSSPRHSSPTTATSSPSTSSFSIDDDSSFTEF